MWILDKPFPIPKTFTIFTDSPTGYRVVRNGKKRVVYARHDYTGLFVRYVTHLSQREIDSYRRKEYGIAKVGICNWTEVHEHEFA